MTEPKAIRIIVTREAIHAEEEIAGHEKDRLLKFVKKARDPDEPDPGLRKFETTSGNYFHCFPREILCIAEMRNIRKATGGPDLGVER